MTRILCPASSYSHLAPPGGSSQPTTILTITTQLLRPTPLYSRLDSPLSRIKSFGNDTDNNNTSHSQQRIYMFLSLILILCSMSSYPRLLHRVQASQSITVPTASIRLLQPRSSYSQPAPPRGSMPIDHNTDDSDTDTMTAVIIFATRFPPVRKRVTRAHQLTRDKQ